MRVLPGKEFTRRDGTQARAGEPLVKTRFPLSKLDLFAQHKNGASDRGKIEQEIKDYFGLKFVPAGADGTREFDHWEYIGDSTHGTKIYKFASPDNDSNKECVLSLDDVANMGREPNFFELLQAGPDGFARPGDV